MSALRQGLLRRLHAWRRDVGKQIELDLAQVGQDVEGRLLDLGCGDKPYRALFPRATEYVGIDLPVQHSANKMEKRADVFADLAQLPLADRSFDAVVCTQVLEHVPDPDAVLAEAARVLKTGGSIVLTIPFLAAEHEEPHDYLRFTQYGITALLERNGFAGVRVRKQFGFWSAIGEMIYWHFHRRVHGTWLEKFWFAFGTTVMLRSFHLLNAVDRDEKLALNLCVTARRHVRFAPPELEQSTVSVGAIEE